MENVARVAKHDDEVHDVEGNPGQNEHKSNDRKCHGKFLLLHCGIPVVDVHRLPNLQPNHDVGKTDEKQRGEYTDHHGVVKYISQYRFASEISYNTETRHAGGNKPNQSDFAQVGFFCDSFVLMRA